VTCCAGGRHLVSLRPWGVYPHRSSQQSAFRHRRRIPILDERIQLWLLAQGAEIEDVIPRRKGGSPNSSGARYPKADRWKRV
jgi:hypothetical protein